MLSPLSCGSHARNGKVEVNVSLKSVVSRGQDDGFSLQGLEFSTVSGVVRVSKWE